MSRQRGFSLVEMALVLTVFGLMLGGMLAPLAKQSQFKREREARRQLGDIVEALYGYALLHGRLPDAVDGDRLPWAVLGVARTDPWGRRWRYRSVRTDPCRPEAGISVRNLEGAPVARVVAVVVSEGERRFDSSAERENRDGDDRFVHDMPTAGRFDDLVAWVLPTVLANRATLAGLCARGTSDGGGGGGGSEDEDED